MPQPNKSPPRRASSGLQVSGILAAHAEPSPRPTCWGCPGRAPPGARISHRPGIAWRDSYGSRHTERAAWSTSPLSAPNTSSVAKAPASRPGSPKAGCVTRTTFGACASLSVGYSSNSTKHTALPQRLLQRPQYLVHSPAVAAFPGLSRCPCSRRARPPGDGLSALRSTAPQ